MASLPLRQLGGLGTVAHGENGAARAVLIELEPDNIRRFISNFLDANR